jgi:hypothetical protein
VGLFVCLYANATFLTALPTYGGVSMKHCGWINDTAGEPGRIHFFYLGEGVPTGTQAISIAHTSSASVKWAAAFTVTAAADTEAGSIVVSSQDLTNGVTNPVLYKGPTTGLGYVCVYNGAALTNLTLTANCTDLNIEDEQGGTQCFRVDRETATSNANVTIGYTQTVADDHAFIAVNIQEVVAGARIQGSYRPLTTTATTTNTYKMQGDIVDKDIFVFAISRDSNSLTADVTCTDNSGANTWTALTPIDPQKSLWVWWKRGRPEDLNASITIASALGSMTFDYVWTAETNGFNGIPHTNLTHEANASGDETHAGITPTNNGSVILFAVGDIGNDTNAVTLLTAATAGTLEPEWVESLSTGGNDCRLTITGKTVASGATGNVTWAQTNSSTRSVLFAVAPFVAGKSVVSPQLIGSMRKLRGR